MHSSWVPSSLVSNSLDFILLKLDLKTSVLKSHQHGRHLRHHVKLMSICTCVWCNSNAQMYFQECLETEDFWIFVSTASFPRAIKKIQIQTKLLACSPGHYEEITVLSLRTGHYGEITVLSLRDFICNPVRITSLRC